MVPLAYDPPLKPGEELAFVRQDKPDAPNLVHGWLQAEPARKLPNLAKIPVLIVAAKASYHAAFDLMPATNLAQAGVPVTFLRLEDADIRGNGHMMMLEKNSDEIAGVLVGLAGENARPAAQREARGGSLTALEKRNLHQECRDFREISPPAP